MPYNPVGMGRPMGATAQSGMPPNRRPQMPGMSPTGPLNLAGPPKMPSPQSGVNTSKPMGGMQPLGMPVAPSMGGMPKPMGMPVAPGGMTGAPPPRQGSGMPSGWSGNTFTDPRGGTAKIGNDMMYDPSVAGPAFGGPSMGGPVAPPMAGGGSRGYMLPGGVHRGGVYGR